jgi:hypothetical protein
MVRDWDPPHPGMESLESRKDHSRLHGWGEKQQPTMALATSLPLGVPSSGIWIGECDKASHVVPCQRRDRSGGIICSLWTEESLKTLKSNLTICSLPVSVLSRLGGGHVCLGLSEGGCRAAIIMENGRTAAGPQEATLPAFHDGGWVPPHGLECFVVAWDGDEEQTGPGSRWAVPKYGVWPSVPGSAPRYGLSAVPQCPSGVLCVCPWLTSYWSIGAIERGVGETGKLGIASQPPCLDSTQASRRLQATQRCMCIVHEQGQECVSIAGSCTRIRHVRLFSWTRACFPSVQCFYNIDC